MFKRKRNTSFFPNCIDLPNEILIHIFSFLAAKDYKYLLICKQWKQFFYENVGFFSVFDYTNEIGESKTINSETKLEIFLKLGFKKLYIDICLFKKCKDKLDGIRNLRISGNILEEFYFEFPKSVKRLAWGTYEPYESDESGILNLENINYFEYFGYGLHNLENVQNIRYLTIAERRIKIIPIFKNIISITIIYENINNTTIDSICKVFENENLEIVKCFSKKISTQYEFILNNEIIQTYDRFNNNVKKNQGIVSKNIKQLSLPFPIKKSLFPNAKILTFISPNTKDIVYRTDIWANYFENITPNIENYYILKDHIIWKQWLENLNYLFKKKEFILFKQLFDYLLIEKERNIKDDILILKFVKESIELLYDKEIFSCEELIYFMLENGKSYLEIYFRKLILCQSRNISWIVGILIRKNNDEIFDIFCKVLNENTGIKILFQYFYKLDSKKIEMDYALKIIHKYHYICEPLDLFNFLIFLSDKSIKEKMVFDEKDINFLKDYLKTLITNMNV